MHLVLDSNVVGRPYTQPGNKNPSEFKLALSDIYGPFDLRSDTLSVKAGTSTRVRITPAYTSSATGLQESLTIEGRKCRFQDESEKMKIFSSYTKVSMI